MALLLRLRKYFYPLYFICLSLWFMLIVCATYAYYRQLQAVIPAFTVASKGSVYNINQLRNQSDLLNIGVGIVAFDPVKGIKTEVAFVPRNNLSDAHSQPKVPVCVSYMKNDLEFKPYQAMDAESVIVPPVGSLVFYPFDTYTAELIIHAHTGPDNKTCSTPLAINPSVLGAPQGFIVTAQVFPAANADNSPDYSSARIQFLIKRTPFHIALSVMGFCVQWAITFMLSFITAWTWKGGKRTELGLMSMNAGFLYAIPRVRDAQPGIPKMGIIQDLCGYCWQTLIVMVSLVALMINFIARKERKKFA